MDLIFKVQPFQIDFMHIPTMLYLDYFIIIKVTIKYKLSQNLPFMPP